MKMPTLAWIGLAALASAQGATRAAAVETQPGEGRLSGVSHGTVLVMASDYRSRTGRVLAVDPVRARIESAVTIGIEPDLIVDRSGRLAYLSYNNERSPGSVLEVIELATGEVVTRVSDTTPWPSHGGAYASRMALSTDGARLFRYQARTKDNGLSYVVQAFDTEDIRQPPAEVEVPLCGGATLLPGPVSTKVYVLCSQSQDVRLLTVAVRAGDAAPPTRLSLTGGDRAAGHLTAFVSPDGRTLTVIKGDGRFVKVDAELRQSKTVDAIDATARRVQMNPGRNVAQNPDDWFASRQLWQQLPVRSPDGSLVYLLTANGRDTRAVRDQIVVLDAESLRRTSTISLSRPLVSITASVDGRELYGFDTLDSAMVVLDAATGRELRLIQDAGPRPVFGVVVP